ncbi:hypothetical protein CEXT_714541 [Caerostris extrusa]|uniref:Uncharacterized protein n=1 Tax=Caerostris extrusa TaxID=172846 RepID=A0AAV4PNW0_CAEEX|nr:hypothetical protein CEXT_714541 [Caerostris extrusa]
MISEYGVTSDIGKKGKNFYAADDLNVYENRLLKSSTYEVLHPRNKALQKGNWKPFREQKIPVTPGSHQIALLLIVKVDYNRK